MLVWLIVPFYDFAKKQERKKQDKNIMSASATQGGHKIITSPKCQCTAVNNA